MNYHFFDFLRAALNSKWVLIDLGENNGFAIVPRSLNVSFSEDKEITIFKYREHLIRWDGELKKHEKVMDFFAAHKSKFRKFDVTDMSSIFDELLSGGILIGKDFYSFD